MVDPGPWFHSIYGWSGCRGSSIWVFINGTMLSIRPGMVVKMTSAELGWREGLPQLRVDSRSTRIQIKSKA